jgi:hypothetical protein
MFRRIEPSEAWKARPDALEMSCRAPGIFSSDTPRFIGEVKQRGYLGDGTAEVWLPPAVELRSIKAAQAT